MSKAVVLFLASTAVLFLLILASPHDHDQRQGGFGLNRRFGYNIADRTPIFDPLVTEMEREASDSDSGSPLSVSEVSETYLYLTGSGRLDMSSRLTLLFPLLDREPKDGLINFKELEAWITQQARERTDYITHIEMESKDWDGDSALSFWEYLPHFENKDLERGETGIDEAGWWHERFIIADTDNNGRLNFTELRDFLYPEDSRNEKLVNWMLKDKLKHIDDQNDGKVNQKEFEEHLYGNYKNYLVFETPEAHVPDAEEKFAELDVNKDQFLSVEELKPIIHYLYPGELSFARFYTGYLMHKADSNNDWKLSLEEMLRHENIFYSTVHIGGRRETNYDRDEF